MSVRLNLDFQLYHLPSVARRRKGGQTPPGLDDIYSITAFVFLKTIVNSLVDPSVAYALKGTSTFGAAPTLTPVFAPVDASGGSAIIGDGRTAINREEKTSKIVLELPPGVKARTEGDENPDVQIVPTGGL